MTFISPAIRHCVRNALLAALGGVISLTAAAASFVHPGMLQNREDLAFMKQKVAAGEEPWKSAYSNLCAEPFSSLSFPPKPVAHVIRGSYGRPSIGDRELMDSANAAYSQALQWVVTGDKIHAQKAIAILNAWSGTLWDFEDNDAKLLAGWTGHVLCNAAEILRATDSGWKKADVGQFKQMLLTVYEPLIQDYFPEANGNWDAAMMDTALCLGIFCDDHAIFDRAADHFLRGAGNAGITKYVYPSGQCEETTRDQAHTQLGLGELAQACQVAWHQRADLYGAADNRLALGIEYTARYMLGEEVPAYGVVSTQGRDHLSDIYEGIWQHYHFVKGLAMPATERAVAQTRAGKSWGALVLYRGPLAKPPVPERPLAASQFALEAGALAAPTATSPESASHVETGESVQAALDGCPNGGWVVLEKGVFVLPAPLRIPSGITLAGQGLATMLILDSKFTEGHAGATLVNAVESLHDVTLRDFVVEGATPPRGSTNAAPAYDYVSGAGSGAVTLHPLRQDPNSDRRQRASPLSPSRAGIIFNAQRPGGMQNLNFAHVTVRDCTHDGVAIRGADHVFVSGCNFSDNGSSVVPGPGLQDNLLLSHVTDARISDSRLDDSPWGSGLEITFGSELAITNNELARNARHGFHATESQAIHISGNLAEGNDCDGLAADVLLAGCRAVEVSQNLVRNNGGHGIELNHVTGGSILDNSVRDNGVPGPVTLQECHSIKH
jgi:hypothetical protein